jgi:hypothetical protein
MWGASNVKVKLENMLPHESATVHGRLLMWGYLFNIHLEKFNLEERETLFSRPLSWIWGSHGGNYEEYCLLRCEVV